MHGYKKCDKELYQVKKLNKRNPRSLSDISVKCTKGDYSQYTCKFNKIRRDEGTQLKNESMTTSVMGKNNKLGFTAVVSIDTTN